MAAQAYGVALAILPRIETMERWTFAPLMVVTLLLHFSLTFEKTFPVIEFAAAFPFFWLNQTVKICSSSRKGHHSPSLI